MTDISQKMQLEHSDEQHQKDILIAHKGYFKFSPEVGVGIQDIIYDEDETSFLIETKRQMQHDGMTINNVSINQYQKLIIDGNY